MLHVKPGDSPELEEHPSRDAEWQEKTDREILTLATELQQELATPLTRGSIELELLALRKGLWRARCAGFKEASDLVDNLVCMMQELGPAGSEGEPTIQACQHEWINVTQFMSDPVISETCGICGAKRTREPGVDADS